MKNKASVEAVFAGYDKTAQVGLRALRRLILEVAAEMPEVGRVEEVLRWGQPAYVTSETKVGSTLRLGVPKSGGFALYVICSTSLIADFKPFAPKGTRFEGARAVLFSDPSEIDEGAMRHLIARALRYHLKA